MGCPMLSLARLITVLHIVTPAASMGSSTSATARAGGVPFHRGVGVGSWRLLLTCVLGLCRFVLLFCQWSMSLSSFLRRWVLCAVTLLALHRAEEVFCRVLVPCPGSGASVFLSTLPAPSPCNTHISVLPSVATLADLTAIMHCFTSSTSKVGA